MIINEKIFLYSILLIIHAEGLRSSSRAYPQQEHFEYYNPQNGFPYGFGRRQGEVQIQNLNRQQPRIQQMQPYEQRQGNVQIQNLNRQSLQQRRDPWSYQGPQSSQTPSPPRPPQTPPTTSKYMNNDEMWGYPSASPPSPQTTSSTTTQRFLPHSPNRWNRTSTPESTSTTSTRRTYNRKHRLQEEVVQEPYDSSKFIVNGKDKALAHIKTSLQPYFLRALVRDFITKLLAAVKVNNVLLSQNEVLAIDNQCTTCTVPELQTLLNILLTILEKYPLLNGEKALAEHVATEYERACDYLNRKFEQLKEEMELVHKESGFKDLQKRYARRERKGGIMSTLLKWFEEYARNGHDNEQELEDNLLKLLTKQKRYWLISIRGIL